MADLMEIVCPQCGKRLKAPAERLGKQAKCPQCKGEFVVIDIAQETVNLLPESATKPTSAAKTAAKHAGSPGASVATPQNRVSANPQANNTPAHAALVSPPPSSVTAPAAAHSPPSPDPPRHREPLPKKLWYLQTDQNEQVGPLDRHELDGLYHSGRIKSGCQILCEGWPQWRWAGEVYPGLVTQQMNQAGNAAAPHDPFGQPADPDPLQIFGGQQKSGGANPLEAFAQPQLGHAPGVAPHAVNLYASPQTVGYAPHTAASNGVPGGQLELEWQSVVAGLRVTQVSLLTCSVAVGIISLLILAADLSQPAPTSIAQERLALIETVTLIMKLVGWSSLALSAAMVAAITGWAIMAEVPRRARSRALVLTALGCVGLGVVLLVLVTLAPIAGQDTASQLKGAASQLKKVKLEKDLAYYSMQVAEIALPLAVFSGLVVYGLFLRQTARFFGKQTEFNLPVIILSGLQCLSLILMLTLTYGLQDRTTILAKTLIYGVFLLVIVSAYGYGWLSTLLRKLIIAAQRGG